MRPVECSATRKQSSICERLFPIINPRSGTHNLVKKIDVIVSSSYPWTKPPNVASQGHTFINPLSDPTQSSPAHKKHWNLHLTSYDNGLSPEHFFHPTVWIYSNGSHYTLMCLPHENWDSDGHGFFSHNLHGPTSHLPIFMITPLNVVGCIHSQVWNNVPMDKKHMISNIIFIFGQIVNNCSYYTTFSGCTFNVLNLEVNIGCNPYRSFCAQNSFSWHICVLQKVRAELQWHRVSCMDVSPQWCFVNSLSSPSCKESIASFHIHQNLDVPKLNQPKRIWSCWHY